MEQCQWGRGGGGSCHMHNNYCAHKTMRTDIHISRNVRRTGSKNTLYLKVIEIICKVMITSCFSIGLTKRSHVAQKMQHVTICDSIVRVNRFRTVQHRLSVRVNMDIPMHERLIYHCIWGERETLSHYIASVWGRLYYIDPIFDLVKIMTVILNLVKIWQ